MTMVENPMMAELISIEPLTEHILKVFLKPEHYIPYQAGQYLQILMPEEAIAYSIANAPLGAHRYELHIRHYPTHPLHQHLLVEMRTQGEVPIFLPLGQCHVGLLDTTKPTLFIAQGTGFAPIKAIIEQWLSDGVMPPVMLCWMARMETDWYMSGLISEWESHVTSLRYHPCLIEMSDEKMVTSLLTLSGFNLSEMQVVMAGPFERMLSLREIMMKKGMRKSQFFSDAFNEV